MPRKPAARNRRLTPRLEERRLTLHNWLLSRLGYSSARALLRDMKKADEGYGADGRSRICYALGEARESQLNGVTIADLRRYDDSIRDHLDAMNLGRAQPITLRYFQYLAALCAEIFLDRWASSPERLLASLNDFVAAQNAGPNQGYELEPYAPSDLRKLAFWMATGSGKTLLLHLNYRQFLRHSPKPPDSVLLITPNESLTAQHLSEFVASNIPAARFDLNESGMLADNRNAVKVIEITKLASEKRGEGERVPVDAFEGDNLIFVDEGHKGSGGDAWREVRGALGKTGFTFEYSATFGQALNAAGKEGLIAEYGKSIAFDYSYRYFYEDGYGKDFRILNLAKETAPDLTDTLLMGNLLSFYEQQVVFAENRDALRPYSIERPLWVFVGGSVNAVYQRRRNAESDILTVARFLHRVLADPAWAADAVTRLLDSESGLRDEYGQDIFAGDFGYLRGRGQTAAQIYDGILARVFRATSGGGLRLCDIRGADGELGLKAASADEYFGVINIGDKPAFKRLAEGDPRGIALEDDALSASLFDRVNDPDGAVDILIGSRKFIEGWNSWRVSNMGLLNIGKSEGSQIIQIFGRGVRLRGRNMSLKRSSKSRDAHDAPANINLLETLNIFAVRADYMAQFREFLKNESIPDAVDIPLFIQPNKDFLNQGLLIPRLDENADFAADATAALRKTDGAKARVDLSASVQRVDSGPGMDEARLAASGAARILCAESLDMVDWDAAYLALIEYKERKGYSNLAVSPNELRGILSSPDAYELIAEEAVAAPRTAADLARLQEAATALLKQYADAVYRRGRAQWETRHMAYKPLDENDPNFKFGVGEAAGAYIVKAQRGDDELIASLRRLISDCAALYRGESEGEPLHRIHFDRHLYQPLLIERLPHSVISISPPPLNDSEHRFVSDLKRYWAKERDGAALAGAEVYLLRNQARGAGVGFFETHGFYPDFILWIKRGDDQRVVFVEPHGLVHALAYEHDDRARLHERLRELEPAIAARSGCPAARLDSYIISATPYECLRRRYGSGDWDRARFAAAHILFADDEGYAAALLNG